MLMYAFAAILLTIYLLTAGFALYMTYDEQRKTHSSNPLLKLVSFVACIAWPVSLVIVALTVLTTPKKPARI